MALNKDYIFYWIEALTGKRSTYTGSCQPKKKFSDVAQYIREFKLLGKSVGGQVSVDTDTGSMFNYKYLFNGKNNQDGYYDITVYHFGEMIKSMEIKYHNPGAAYMTKKAIEKMLAALEDYEAKKVEEKVVPSVDYSQKDLAELLEVIDQKIRSFAANACSATFNEIIPVKEAIDAKINQIPLAERSAYTAPMSNLNMYITTLRTQLSNSMIDVKQFVGTYVPQMQAAVADLAKAAL